MSTYFYPIENNKPLCWKKESTFNETSHLVGDTFFPFPIILTRQPFLYLYRKKTVEHSAGYVDPQVFLMGNYEKGVIELEGRLTDFGIMYLLCAGTVTYSADTPSAGYHTKTITVPTVARDAAKPTFKMLQQITNDTSANTIYTVLGGCHIPYCRIYGRASDFVYAKIRIEFTSATAESHGLTTHPNLTEYANGYSNDMVAVTYTKGGTAYSGTVYDWWFEYNDGSSLDTAVGEQKPGRVLKGPRTIKAGFDKFVWKKTEAFTETDALLPGASSNVHVYFTITRTTSTDTLTFALDHVFELDGLPAGFDHNNYYLSGRKEFIMKGALSETGTCAITEVNATVQARYQ